MSNSTVHQTWVLDTTGTITTDLVRVKGLRWVGATTAGHVCTVSDVDGNVLWTSLASGANYVESDNLSTRPGINWNGFVLTTLGSGKLYVELI